MKERVVRLVQESKRRDHGPGEIQSHRKAWGGKGKLSLDWWIPENSPADLFAFVDLSGDRIWLVTKDEVAHLVHDYDFQKYLLENRVHALL